MIKIKVSLSQYLFFVFFLAVLYISYLILEPYFMAIVTSFIVAFIFYPLYKKVHKKIKSENLSAFIIALAMILIITIPILFLINTVAREASEVYSDLSIKLTEDEKLFSINCDTEGPFCNAINTLNENAKFRFYVSGAITTFASGVTRSTSEFLFSIPFRILNGLIIFMLVFFLLKGGKKVWDLAKELLPLKENQKIKILKKFSNTINGVVYGYLIIALIEAFIMWFAFTTIGNEIALLLGIMTGIMALIPMIGAPLIWVPAALIYFFGGSPYKALVLVVAGAIIMFLDLWVRNLIIGDKTDIHPAVVAIGVLGGLTAFGAIGIIIGPLILSILITTLDIYKEEKQAFI